MSEFVDECRREWGRLGVPPAVANEMAADLSADLDEAEAEGGSPEDVLGNSAFDPRRFAAAWAGARGVMRPPAPAPPSRWQLALAIALTALLVVLTFVAGLALLSGHSSSSIGFAIPRIMPAPGSDRLFVPGGGRIAIPGPFGRVFAGQQIAGLGIRPLALVLFIFGAVCLVLLAVLYWWPRFGPRRYHRQLARQYPSWS